MTIEELTTYNDTDYQSLKQLVSTLSTHRLLSPALLDDVLHTSDSHLLVARERNKIVGMCTVGIYASPTGRKASLEDVAVLPEAQGKGIGKQLVNFAVTYLQQRGVKHLLFTSRPSRIAANALYRSMGFSRKETNVYVYEDFQ
ncbi:MAG: GNAT family N-acetyltransferase [Clostridium sp.]|nr:GNAT family N-acetyltransferase [Clostridium sp.]